MSLWMTASGAPTAPPSPTGCIYLHVCVYIEFTSKLSIYLDRYRSTCLLNGSHHEFVDDCVYIYQVCVHRVHLQNIYLYRCRSIDTHLGSHHKLVNDCVGRADGAALSDGLYIYIHVCVYIGFSSEISICLYMYIYIYIYRRVP